MEATEAKAPPEWSIQDVARLAGTTSRTLRHYDDIGLLRPSRVGSKGYRANYGGEAGAGFVRRALRVYAEKHL